MKNRVRTTVFLSAMLLQLNWLSALGDEIAKENGNLNATLRGQPVFEFKGSKNLNGEVRIVSRQSDAVIVNYEKSARTSSKAESSRFLELIDFKLSVFDDRAVLGILSPAHAPWEGSNYSVQVNVIVELPEKMEIKGTGNYMKFQIEGPFQGVKLNSTFSDMEIQRIYGPVDLKTTFGDVDLDAIKGETRVETENGEIVANDMIINSGYAVFQATHGSIDLTNITGQVEAYTSYSEISANNIQTTDGSVVLRTSYGAVRVEDVLGELICETSYAPINVLNTSINHGHSRIETSHAPVVAEFKDISDCELYIANVYNNIDLSIPDDISAKLIASVGNGGRISAKNLDLRPTMLDVTRLEAFIGEGESRIEVNVGGIGNINIDGR